MMNKILAVIIGVISGVMIVFLGEMFTHMLFPPPPGIDISNPEALQKIIADLPASAFILLMSIWALSSFSGGLIAGLITKGDWKKSAIITGAILLLGAIMNMFMVPHPIWVNLITVVMYLPLSYLGGRLVNKRAQ